MQMALVAWPHSGRTCDRSWARPSIWCLAATGVIPSGAEPNRRARSWALRTVASRRTPSASSSSARWLAGARSRSEKIRLSFAVLCNPPTKTVSRGIAMPRGSSAERTRGSFSIWTMARALAAPGPPPQAPQSCADSCGLFMLVEPWPKTNTSREKLEVMPMSRRIRSLMSIISVRR